jgi:hypothetical protein
VERSRAADPCHLGAALVARCRACEGSGTELDDCPACGRPWAGYEGEGGGLFCDDVCEGQWLASGDAEDEEGGS